MADDFEEFEVPPLRMAAQALHELYLELRRAGFTKSEAITLVAKTLAGGVAEQADD